MDLSLQIRTWEEPLQCFFYIYSTYFSLLIPFKCFTRTYMNNQSDTVVNWLLEQFVNPHVLYEYRNNKSLTSDKIN